MNLIIILIGSIGKIMVTTSQQIIDPRYQQINDKYQACVTDRKEAATIRYNLYKNLALKILDDCDNNFAPIITWHGSITYQNGTIVKNVYSTEAEAQAGWCLLNPEVRLTNTEWLPEGQLSHKIYYMNETEVKVTYNNVMEAQADGIVWDQNIVRNFTHFSEVKPTMLTSSLRFEINNPTVSTLEQLEAALKNPFYHYVTDFKICKTSIKILQESVTRELQGDFCENMMIADLKEYYGWNSQTSDKPIHIYTPYEPIFLPQAQERFVNVDEHASLLGVFNKIKFNFDHQGSETGMIDVVPFGEVKDGNEGTLTESIS